MPEHQFITAPKEYYLTFIVTLCNAWFIQKLVFSVKFSLLGIPYFHTIPAEMHLNRKYFQFFYALTWQVSKPSILSKGLVFFPSEKPISKLMLLLDQDGGKKPLLRQCPEYFNTSCGLNLSMWDLFFWDCSPAESKSYWKISSHQPFPSSQYKTKAKTL